MHAQVDEARAGLRSFDVLDGLPDALLDELARVVRRRSVAAGEVLLREGDAGTDVLLLLAGEVEAVRGRGDGEAVLARIRGAVPLGEVQALIGGERTATVRAVTACELLELPGADFEALARAHPVLVERLAVYARARLRRSQLQAALATRYGNTDVAVLAALEAAVEWCEVSRGEVFVRQGEPSDAVFFLVQGALVAVREGPGGASTVVGEIFAGESFGETAVLPGQTRGATVRATRASVVGRIPQHAILGIVERHPAVLRRFLEVVVERQQADPHAARGHRRARTVAFVPLAPDVPLRAVTDRVVAALARAGKTVRVDHDTVRHHFGVAQLAAEHAPLAFRLEYWFEVLRAEHDVVVLEGDTLDSLWTRRCVEGATEVVLVGVASGDPTVQGAERALLGAASEGPALRTTLVLLLPPDAYPTRTARWFAGRHVDTTLHVHADRVGDYERVARFLTGRAVGLVLSGGGARSFAGVGVLRVLSDLGVPVDAVGGVSAGALVAALVADGLPPDDIHDKLWKFIWATRLTLGLPIVSLLPTHPLLRPLRALWGDARIEDLLLPSCFVSVNLTRASQRVATRGELVGEVLATNSMPGVFPPVVLDGDLHVDGALLNNVPIAEVKALVRGGPVIAVDVTPSVEFAENAASGLPLSGPEVLRGLRKHSAHGTQAPHLVNLLIRSQLLHHVTIMRELRSQADLYLQPDVSRYSFIHYHRHRDIAALAYAQTIASARAWWATDRDRHEP